MLGKLAINNITASHIGRNTCRTSRRKTMFVEDRKILCEFYFIKYHTRD